MIKEDAYKFKGLFTPMSFEDYKTSQENNRKYVKSQQDFYALINKDTSIEELRNILKNDDLIQNSSSNQLMRLFTAFRDVNAFDEMIELFEKSSNQTFKDSLMVNELLMVAYNKKNQPDKTIELGQRLVKEKRISGDIFGGLGKAYLLKSKTAKSEQDKKRYLNNSKSAYEAGFAEFAEFYPGINAVYRYIDLGEIKQARELAKLVYLACKKEGAEETHDYWCTTTKLEAGCIAGQSKKELEASLKDLLSYNVPKWQFETTLETLKNVNENYQSADIDLIIDELSKKIELLDNENNKRNTHETNRDEKLESVVNNSYSYRGLASNFEGASSVGGNFRFGGQLPDHSISRKDVEIFDGILNTPIKELFPVGIEIKGVDPNTTIQNINDVDLFLNVVDKFIRFHYGTENFANTGLHLEQNAEINNSVYDQTVDALIGMSGIKGNKLADSRTNISAIFALGLGDCRHHAQVKQLLFDRWQGRKMKKAILTAYACMGHKEIYDKAIAKFNELYKMELRTIDICVSMPIQIKSMYNAEKDGEKFIESKDGKDSVLEEHTMNILVKRNDNDELESLYITDSFYQKNYDWKHFKVDVENIKVTEDGKFIIDAGELSGKRVNSGKSLPIKIIPTAYAGKRDVHSKDDHGNNITLLGIPFNIKSTEDLVKILQKREYIEKVLNSLRENGNIENARLKETENS